MGGQAAQLQELMEFFKIEPSSESALALRRNARVPPRQPHRRHAVVRARRPLPPPKAISNASEAPTRRTPWDKSFSKLPATAAVAGKTARPAASTAPRSQQYLTFLLGGEMFAVGILNVKEIIEYGQLTEIPMMPAFIRGVINLRGSVVPVIDLAARFGHAQSEVGKRTCIVIVESARTRSATTSASWSMRCPKCSKCRAPTSNRHPSFGAKIRADFIDGMGKIGGKFVIILDIQKVLSVDEIATLATNVSGEIVKLREGGAYRGSQRGRRGEQRAGA
jgi:purine-binding chemotaxis protein CheW